MAIFIMTDVFLKFMKDMGVDTSGFCTAIIGGVRSYL